jgi:hypothetical protein
MGCSPSTNQIDPLLKISVNSLLPDQNPALITLTSTNKKCNIKDNNVAKKSDPPDTEILAKVAMKPAERPGNIIPVGKVLPVLARAVLPNKTNFENKFLESSSESQDKWTNAQKLPKKMLETEKIDYLAGLPKILPLVRSPELPVLLAEKNTPFLTTNFGQSIPVSTSFVGTRKKCDGSDHLENPFDPLIKSPDTLKSFQDYIHRTDAGTLSLGKLQPSLA